MPLEKQKTTVQSSVSSNLRNPIFHMSRDKYRDQRKEPFYKTQQKQNLKRTYSVREWKAIRRETEVRHICPQNGRTLRQILGHPRGWGWYQVFWVQQDLGPSRIKDQQANYNLSNLKEQACSLPQFRTPGATNECVGKTGLSLKCWETILCSLCFASILEFCWPVNAFFQPVSHLHVHGSLLSAKTTPGKVTY